MHFPYKFVATFKAGLFVVAIGIIFGVMIHTDRMVNDLRESSRRYLTLKVERFKQLFMLGDDVALDTYLSEMASKDFPLIVADADGVPISWSGVTKLDDLPYEEAKLYAVDFQRDWLKQGNTPVMIDLPEFGLRYYFYYGDTEQIRRLRHLPWIEVVMVGGLILLGYLGFVSIKKSEERSVWIGMARETAHQLGTPLTSLYGWVELLGEREMNDDLKREITNDLERLRSVTERFNQIGSATQLSAVLLKPIIDKAAGYIQRRVPDSIEIVTEVPEGLSAKVNPTLFEWVFENLIKNGAEAMKGRNGQVKVTAYERNGRLIIDVTDNGTGIPRRLWKEVFRPGYTTKSRGWGLGLSLARRIVEDLHRGRIQVVESSSDRGTTLRVVIRT